MFLKAISLDNQSYIELSDRITSDGTMLQISMRGVRDDKSTTLMSALLKKEDAALLGDIISEWLNSTKVSE